MEDQEPASSRPNEPARALRKRQKVAIACTPCRRKKIKCDAARPVDLELPVDVTHGESTPRSQSGNHSRSNCSQDASPAGESVYDGERPPGLALHSGNECIEPRDVDSMNGMMGDPAQTSQVFGNSSAGAFMRQIQAAINSKLGPLVPPAKGKTPRLEECPPGDRPHISHEDAALSVLPPRSLADTLIRAYWDFDWVLYPIVDKINVEAAYESLWTPTGNTCPRLSLSIINLCFAIGCLYCESLSPKERCAMGNDFFARAERLYKREEQAPSVERVQCLLLCGSYLQSTDKVYNCWMTVGEAIRMAQCLGIHQPALSETVSHRETRRRVWHGCVWLDR
ncbi:hypothetical protein AbraIFM66950_005389 [Aspergillus brasiliensis]|nr:hypothetical protein AbraIFM66950_005389 [Aspergillus brasiliensis]